MYKGSNRNTHTIVLASKITAAFIDWQDPPPTISSSVASVSFHMFNKEPRLLLRGRNNDNGFKFLRVCFLGKVTGSLRLDDPGDCCVPFDGLDSSPLFSFISSVHSQFPPCSEMQLQIQRMDDSLSATSAGRRRQTSDVLDECTMTEEGCGLVR